MRKKRKIVNLYEDTNTINIKHVISIASEEDLDHFWNYMDTCSFSNNKLMNTLITHFYNFTLSHLLKEETTFFEIILEDSEEYIYFTLWNKKVSALFKQYIELSSVAYKHNNIKLSIRLDKLKLKEEIKVPLVKKVFIPAYTFVNVDDLEELLRFSEDMNELMIHSKKIGLQEDLFISLRSILSMFCLTLRYYQEISKVADVITKFSNLINTNKDTFTQFDNDEISLVEGFLSNIDKWLHTLFITGGAELHFMDNSLEADFKMIEQIINPLLITEIDSDLDDIFDF